MSLKAVFRAEDKRPYLVVKAELARAREEFQSLYREHESVRLKVTRHDTYRAAREKFRRAAVAAGVITPDDDFNDAYSVPPRMKVPDELQERFHQQHYIVAELEAEEAGYSALEKGRAFSLAASGVAAGA